VWEAWVIGGSQGESGSESELDGPVNSELTDVDWISATRLKYSKTLTYPSYSRLSTVSPESSFTVSYHDLKAVAFSVDSRSNC
jgi:hypothetical protein